VTWCHDRRRHQRQGEDDARRDPGRRYDHDYRERERNARYEPYGCDAAYVRGFEDELRRLDDEREERERAEEREAARLRHDREDAFFEGEGDNDDD
jgi:hypothetical protein